ncbi:hypothetical protein M272_14630 [Vibrio natriegens NBRC 15636 = ATCC 14048 = DSM 759]|nr:hypothetical protein M272_14630 [Vibrio natriegens NBRC 15636 = ATCC 14048 = DSM 759]
MVFTPLLIKQTRISVDNLYKCHDHRFKTILIIFSET